MFKHIGLIASNRTSSGIAQTLEQVRTLLQDRGITVSYSPSCARLLSDLEGQVTDLDNFGDDCELVIVIGGDGTMLSVAHSICHKKIPLLGINRGHLGFLADIPADAVTTHLERILDGDYVEEERFMLTSEVLRDGQTVFTGNAFNDIVIQKGNIARLVQF
ncbi:MAG: NAD(+)/NADH kinase, partial [Thiotrichales bacterium]|nr:NAD(+)/NADH kinase [Thiotrichales bacterium]